jgi:hypothetical protein
MLVESERDRHPGDLLAKGRLLLLDLQQALLEQIVLALDGVLLALELLDLEPLPLPGRLRRLSVPKDPLDAALFLFIFGLCAFSAVR